MCNPRELYSIDPGLIPEYERAGLKNLDHSLEIIILLDTRRGEPVSRSGSGGEGLCQPYQ